MGRFLQQGRGPKTRGCDARSRVTVTRTHRLLRRATLCLWWGTLRALPAFLLCREQGLQRVVAELAGRRGGSPFDGLDRPRMLRQGGFAHRGGRAGLACLLGLVSSARSLRISDAAKGIERRRHLRMIALATGLGDKSVSLLYQRPL